MSSNNAKSPEAEMNCVNKKAENNDADNSNSSSKRMKIDVNEGIRNKQKDYPSHTGRKFKDKDADNSNSASKKLKRNVNEGIRNEQNDNPPHTGRKFQNIDRNNICYINSVLNGLLALDKYRERFNDRLCECNLCNFLISTEANAINLRIWVSQYNPIFSVHGRHEDAEEFLRVLIEKCSILSNLAQFSTKEKHTCTVCGTVTHIREE